MTSDRVDVELPDPIYRTVRFDLAYRERERPMSDWVDQVITQMTEDEKIRMLSGADLWRTVGIDRLGVPSLKVSDGPNGVRGEDDNHGPTSTSFPVGVAMGATFDPELIEKVGEALAHETRAKSASVLLGPTINIPRVPIAGRNFECFSEDPVLSGTIAGAYIRGLQSQGVGACLKHFVCNDQEHERFSIDARVDERSLREIYLEPFRIAIESGRPWSVMSAYNTINGVTASEHPMLDEVLRGDLGFDGAVISDWYGTYGSGVVPSGLDLEMPGPPRWVTAEHWRSQLADGSVSTADLDRKVGHMLVLIERSGAASVDPAHPERADEKDADRALVRSVATEAMVLLANDGVLPLTGEPKIALIGQPADRTFHQGGGSSAVNAHRVVSVREAMELVAGDRISWSLGCDFDRTPPAMDASTVSFGDGKPGLFVEYFNGPDLEGEPVRSVPARKSFLGFFGPGNKWVDYSSYSLRMSGTFTAQQSGAHVFTATADANLRVWSDGEIVVDAWDLTEGDSGEWGRENVERHLWKVTLDVGESVDLVVEYGSVKEAKWRFVGVGCAILRSEDPIADAVALARNSDVAVVVVGLGQEWESEGFDRPDMCLPGEQDRLVAEVAAVQPKTIVVVMTGSPIEMPWLNDVAAVVQAWYAGQEAGHAISDVLFGAAEPGGRLPVTFPDTARRHPGMLNYPGEAGSVRYGEGVYVGYRGFDRMQMTPQFEFGHGLSYSTFDAGSVGVSEPDGPITVSVELTNTGDRGGTEVVLVWATGLGVDRKLVGFRKVRMEAGASELVELALDPKLLRVWDLDRSGWVDTRPTGFIVSGTFGRRNNRIGIRWRRRGRGLTRPLGYGCGVGPRGLEPRTSSLSGKRSNRAELWAPRHL